MNKFSVLVLFCLFSAGTLGSPDQSQGSSKASDEVDEGFRKCVAVLSVQAAWLASQGDHKQSEDAASKAKEFADLLDKTEEEGKRVVAHYQNFVQMLDKGKKDEINEMIQDCLVDLDTLNMFSS